MFDRRTFAMALAVSTLATIPVHAADNGVVKGKSAYSMAETIDRLKKDVAAKGITFFAEIDQAKLAADAGITLEPSTLLIFGNPALGSQFMTSNPSAGIDWPVRLLVIEDKKGQVWTVYNDYQPYPLNVQSVLIIIAIIVSQSLQMMELNYVSDGI